MSAAITNTLATGIISAIPSPPFSDIALGPLHIHLYGVAIALGVIAAVQISTARWTARGGTADDITALAMWGVPAGILGARLYHVITDFELYRHNLLHAFAIWDGGLGIWGGIAVGVGTGLWVGRRRGLALPALMDMVAPALAVAQAIGRWGNYFNQELFGRPTTLPWGLHVDIDHRPPGYEAFSTFHPTFLYESLWDLMLAAALVLAERRFRRQLRPGQIFALYVAGYTFGRFFVERLRIDFAHTFAGLRLNDWTSLVVFVMAMGWLGSSWLRPQPAEPGQSAELGQPAQPAEPAQH